MHKGLDDIIEKCGDLEIHEKRNISDEYVELVFYSKDTDKWMELLSGVFGSAVKSPGTNPDKDMRNLTKEHGGVNRDQTLFKTESENKTVIAMFWPWGDTVHTTLKVAVL